MGSFIWTILLRKHFFFYKKKDGAIKIKWFKMLIKAIHLLVQS